jgi:hypothetical protein
MKKKSLYRNTLNSKCKISVTATVHYTMYECILSSMLKLSKYINRVQDFKTKQISAGAVAILFEYFRNVLKLNVPLIRIKKYKIEQMERPRNF